MKYNLPSKDSLIRQFKKFEDNITELKEKIATFNTAVDTINTENDLQSGGSMMAMGRAAGREFGNRTFTH